MTKVGPRQHHKPACQVRWLSTSHQIARRGGNSGYRLVNKSRVNAGADQRHHPIKPANPSQSRPQNVFGARRQQTDGNEIPMASDALPPS